MLQLWVLEHPVPVGRRRAPAEGQGCLEPLQVSQHLHSLWGYKMPVEMATERLTLLLKRMVHLGLISIDWALLQKRFWHLQDESFLKLQV